MTTLFFSFLLPTLIWFCGMAIIEMIVVYRAKARTSTPTLSADAKVVDRDDAGVKSVFPTPVPTSTPFLAVKDAYNIYKMYCGRDYTCRVCGEVNFRNLRNDNYNPTSCHSIFRITEWDGSKDEVHVTYVQGEDTITIQYTDDVVHMLSLHAFFALKPYHSDGTTNLGMGLDTSWARWAITERELDLDKLIF